MKLDFGVFKSDAKSSIIYSGCFSNYREELEKEQVDDRKFTVAAALGTIISKFFGVRGQHFNSLLERCPTFVSKDKSLFKARFIGKGRKVR